MSYEWNENPENPDAYPVMKKFLNLFGGWSIEEWMQWHGAMKKRYGLEYANRQFLIAWADDGILSGPPLDARSFNSAFRDYAKSNGFYDGLYYGLGVIAKPLGAGNDILDAVSNVSEAAKKTSKAANWLLPVALVAAALVFFWPHIARARLATGK